MQREPVAYNGCARASARHSRRELSGRTVCSVCYMVLAGNFLFWTLTVHLIKVTWTSPPAQPQVVGSLQPILAMQGDDVILPCHLEPSVNVEALTVEWMKPDLKPDPSDRLSRIEYVHLYRDRREVPDMKLRTYVRRTALFVDDLKHGNISLKIMNVTQADAGRYRCFIPKLNSRVKDSIVQLIVVPNFVKPTTETLPENPPVAEPDNEGVRVHVAAVVSFVCLLVVCGVVVGHLLKRKHGSVSRRTLMMRRALFLLSVGSSRVGSRIKSSIGSRESDVIQPPARPARPQGSESSRR